MIAAAAIFGSIMAASIAMVIAGYRHESCERCRK
jgi:hypothetical protein